MLPEVAGWNIMVLVRVQLLNSMGAKLQTKKRLAAMHFDEGHLRDNEAFCGDGFR